MQYRYLHSPLGPLLLAGEAEVLYFVGFPDQGKALTAQPDWRINETALGRAAEQLDQYFAGERREFDIELRPHGTAFQCDVLAALCTIPYGETRSYRDIATQIGRPRAVRAVGAANGRNPLPIVIPCHRVIGTDGSLTGFGGGLEAKQYLLALEATTR